MDKIGWPWQINWVSIYVISEKSSPLKLYSKLEIIYTITCIFVPAVKFMLHYFNMVIDILQ